MPSTVIIGTQWGDEGKGKIVDLVSENADLIARYQGGANAGHTIKVDGEQTILHLVPSGILHSTPVCVIGNGVVFDPEIFLSEINALKKKGINVSPKRLAISNKAHIIMPYHKTLDKAREAKRAGKKIGTTGKGIGPCYEDKACRIGIRAGDLRSPELLRSKIEYALQEKNILLKNLYNFEEHSVDEIMDNVMAISPEILPYIQDTDAIIHKALAEDKKILLEGAQGVHLDIDHGTYPYVTSSTTISGGACSGAALSPKDIDEVIGVVKAYTTRVGEGPFPTELEDDTGRYLQTKGHEFGATTGRPRRCGWLDLVILRESVRLNGLTGIAITKLDVLEGLPELKICVEYELDGNRLQYPPQNEGELSRVKPVYITMPGFEADLSKCKKYDELPEEARNYIAKIEEILNVPVDFVSVGPGREQTIKK